MSKTLGVYRFCVVWPTSETVVVFGVPLPCPNIHFGSKESVSTPVGITSSSFYVIIFKSETWHTRIYLIRLNITNIIVLIYIKFSDFDVN